MTGRRRPVVRVEVLGPLRLVVDGAVVDVRGPKRRAVLAMLALAEGRTVTVDALVDALWPSGIPESGRQGLHSHVFRLRADLGAAGERLATVADGYRLDLGDGGLDVAQARALLASARVEESADVAVRRLRDAHALWRGAVLADLADVRPIAAATEGIEHLRRDVVDALIGAALAAGQADRVTELAAVAYAEEPLREPAVLQQMRVLAATGRAAEALSTGRRYRRRLAQEAGLDPSPALAEVESRIAAGAGSGTDARTGGAPPAPGTRLYGRDGQVAALHRLLTGERLVTVVGPGGVGKTRVALEVAAHSEPAQVLLLAAVADADAVPHALAAALGLEITHGDVLAACLAILGDRPGLLVVDNCEHLLAPVRDLVGRLLSACPGYSVLTTSREPLGLPAEYTYRLSPLVLPEPDGEPEKAPSVALFLDRAARVRPDLRPSPEDVEAAADIVRGLDGMPLAIELAASRLSTFSVADLRGRLGRALDLLGSRQGADPRHRTLRSTIDWSYELLTDAEKLLFRRMSVFVDGLGPDDAERLAADLALDEDPGAVLARLVDISMLDAQFAGGTRYRMLRTVRGYGLDRLAAAGEEGAALDGLLAWAVDLTARVGEALTTEQEADADAALRRELPNLRVAWRVARDRHDLDSATAVVTQLFDAVAYRDLVEIRDWAEELARDPALPDHRNGAAVLGTAAEAAYHRGDHSRAENLAQAGLAGGGDGAWRCRMVLSVVALARGAHADAVEHALATVDAVGPAREGLGIAALATAYAGDVAAARPLNDRGRASAVSTSMVAWGEYVAGEIEGLLGDGEAAERHYVRAIDLARSCGATFLVGVATVGLLSVRVAAGLVEDSLRGYRDVVDYFARTGNWTHLWVTLRNLADLLRRLGDHGAAAVIEASADHAPDAPATGRDTEPAPAPALPGRPALLTLVREAIERQLGAAR